jgi:phytoene dehydrogenase-like protein
MGTVSESIASSARSFGAEIRTEAPVSKILVKGGKAVGVVLEDGEEIRAKAVASGVDPKLTFLKMVDPGDVPEEFLEDIRRINMRGCCGKVNLALDGLPSPACRATARTCGGPLCWPRAPSTWSGPTTRPSTGGSPGGP